MGPLALRSEMFRQLGSILDLSLLILNTGALRMTPLDSNAVIWEDLIHRLIFMH